MPAARPSAPCLVAGGLILLGGLGLLRAAGTPNLPAALLQDVGGIDVIQPGLWLLLCGTLLCALAFGNPLPRAAPWIALLAAAVLAAGSVGTLVDEGKTGEVFGRTVYWLDDDMMISLRYARNLAEGHGLTWNAGEAVEGYTNFLWTLALVPLYWMAGETRVALWAIVLNTALLLALLLGVYRLARRAGGSALAGALACLAVATSAALLHWTSAGGESVLVALLLVLQADSSLAEGPGRDRRVGLLGGLATLTRPDAAVAALVLFLFAQASRPEASRGARWLTRQRALALLWLLALPLAHTAFRWAYYGSPLPNTYHLKATGWPGKSLAGVRYLLEALPRHALLLGFALAAPLVERRARRLSAAVLAHLAYVAYVGGDELPEQRFLVPLLPILFVAAFLGADGIARRVAGGRPAAAPLLPALAFTIAGFGVALLPGSMPLRIQERSQGEHANAALGFLIRANTTEEARVAHFWAGATAYFSDRAGIDFYGKCDAHVARLAARPGLMAPGHNKYDLSYSLAKNPDVIVNGLGGRAAGDSRLLAQLKGTNYRAFVDLLEHAEFQRSYFDPRASQGPRNLVGASSSWPPEVKELSLGWHGVFVRQGSEQARPAAEWSLP